MERLEAKVEVLSIQNVCPVNPIGDSYDVQQEFTLMADI